MAMAARSLLIHRHPHPSPSPSSSSPSASPSTASSALRLLSSSLSSSSASPSSSSSLASPSPLASVSTSASSSSSPSASASSSSSSSSSSTSIRRSHAFLFPIKAHGFFPSFHYLSQRYASTHSSSSPLPSSSSSSSSFGSPRKGRSTSARATAGGGSSAPSHSTEKKKKQFTKERNLSGSDDGKKQHKDSVFSVPVILEDSLDMNPEIETLLEQLENDGPLAVKLAVEGLEDLEPSETTELSLVICDDAYIHNLNKEWRGEDSPTDVLSFPQDQPPGVSSLLLLGDVIISLDTAKRQALERGHSVLDELRILLVHGLLHVLGYDHEEDPEAAAEMEKEEIRILQTLGWNSRGLISAAADADAKETSPGHLHGEPKEKSKAAWKRKPLFKVLLCDMDGTLLNSQSKISERTAASLKEALARGVKVIIATGKTRPGAMTACSSAGLAGENGIISESSAGVFVQGLMVYGPNGKLINNRVLDRDICIKALQYCAERKQPVVAFCGDQLVSLFEHHLTEELHTIYMEPKPLIVPSVDDIVNNFQIQKVVFTDTPEQITNVIRPYWSREMENIARVVQAQEQFLEIIPAGTSKGNGVSLLLDHMGVHPDDAMAIGDGENDIEMLQLVGWGVAMANGAAQTLAVADAQVSSNDEDGVVEALERFLLT